MSQDIELQQKSQHGPVMGDGNEKSGPRWWNMKSWSKRTASVVLALALAVIITVVIVVPVEVERKKNECPDYSRLDYSVVDSYSGTGFFEGFVYFGGTIDYNAAGGFVPDWIYGEPTSIGPQNNTHASSSSANLTVSNSVTVEIISKKQYTSGLFLFDILHVPTGCSTWPAIRVADPYDWPLHGEIAVMSAIQTVNDSKNTMSLHTKADCNMNVKRKQTSKTLSTTCTNLPPFKYTEGCAVDAGPGTYGTTLNANGGVLMAVELRSEGIRIWQFPRSSIPPDISNGTPDPSIWPEATADFPNTHCDIGTHFRNQSIVVTISVCGSWEDGAPNWAVCKSYCTTESETTGYNIPHKDAYWEISSITVYEGS